MVTISIVHTLSAFPRYSATADIGPRSHLSRPGDVQ